MKNNKNYFIKIFEKIGHIFKDESDKQKKYYWILGIIILIMSLYSLQTLTTKPRIWSDEGLSIELSRNFMLFQKLDVQVSPGEFSNLPEYLQSSGYPVLVPATLFFKVFGFSFVTVRLYMLFWMILTIILIFIFLRRIFSPRMALCSILLIVTFASFHANGRSLVGEIPGLFFLVMGLYLWWFKKQYVLSGILFGLAVVTKPSVYLNILPAIFLIGIFYEKKMFFRNMFKIIIGTIPAVLIWIFFIIPNPFTLEPWIKISRFFSNPYDSISVIENIKNNLIHLPYQLSFVYFVILFAIIIYGFYKIDDKYVKSLYYFTIVYAILSVFYYIRSPGWMRYLIATEIFILMLFPYAIYNLVLKVQKRWEVFNSAVVYVFIIGIFLVVQTLQLFFMSHIYYSDSAILTVDYLRENLYDKSIGLVNVPEIAAFVEPDKKYQVINHLLGIPQLGDVNVWPELDVLILYGSDKLGFETFAQLLPNYIMIDNIKGYEIYQLINKNI